MIKEWIKKTGMNWGLNNFLFTLIVISFYSCKEITFHEKITHRLKKESDLVSKSEVNYVEIKPKELFDFNFEYLYFVSGPRFEGEVKSILNINEDRTIKDDYVGVYLVNKGSLIYEEEVSTDKISISSTNGFLCFLKDSSMMVKVSSGDKINLYKR